MLHTLAYTASLGSVTNNDTPALSDDVVVIQNTHFILPNDMSLVAAAAFGGTLDRARVNSPTLRVVSPQYIRPVNVAVKPASNPLVLDLTGMPFDLPKGEEIAVEMTTTGAGPSQSTVLLWLADQITSIPSGDLHIIRATSTTAAVANVWTTVQYALDQTLPAGDYMLIGSSVVSTNAVAHRWIIPGQTWRPGMLSQQSVGDQPHDLFREHRLGSFGRFNNFYLPPLQVLSGGTDASHVIYMHVVRL